MKIKRVNELNEGIRDQMKGASDEKILKGLYNDMLNNSAKMGFLVGIKKALELGADDIFNGDALSIACSNGHVDIIRYLVEEKGIDVNYYDGYYTPLGRAIQHGNLEVVKLLVELGANVNHVVNAQIGYSLEKYTMIGFAEAMKRPSIVKYLKSLENNN